MFKIWRSLASGGPRLSINLLILTLVVVSVTFGAVLTSLRFHLRGYGHTDPMDDVFILFILVMSLFFVFRYLWSILGPFLSQVERQKATE